MAKYNTHFIPQNKAPKNHNYIYVYNGNTLVGKIRTGSLTMPQLGDKLYSFAALSDIHVTDSTTAMSRFQKALAYLKDTEKVSFVCISGDVTSSGTEEQFESFRTAIAPYPQNFIHTCTGNHDCQQLGVAPFRTKASTQDFTGRDLYYTFTQGNDVFIMFGMSSWYYYTKEPIFTAEALEWLDETLKANSDKRCFVFEHCPRFDGSGKVEGWDNPTGDLLIGDAGNNFKTIVGKYKNVIWFHGHSHMQFQDQTICSHLNYDNMFGCQSVHIPGLANVRAANLSDKGYTSRTSDGMGYVVDVYEEYVVLRGRTFAEDKFLPIATFCLDTTVQEIPANAFTDSTGTITT